MNHNPSKNYQDGSQNGKEDATKQDTAKTALSKSAFGPWLCITDNPVSTLGAEPNHTMPATGPPSKPESDKSVDSTISETPELDGTSITHDFLSKGEYS